LAAQHAAQADNIALAGSLKALGQGLTLQDRHGVEGRRWTPALCANGSNPGHHQPAAGQHGRTHHNN